MQLAAGPGERGHDGTNGNRWDRSDLLVGTAFELSKDKDFAETGRQGLEGTAEALPIFIGDRDRFGSSNRSRVQFFVKFNHQFPRTIFFQPGVTRVTRSEEHTSELQSHLNIVCRL